MISDPFHISVNSHGHFQQFFFWLTKSEHISLNNIVIDPCTIAYSGILITLSDRQSVNRFYLIFLIIHIIIEWKGFCLHFLLIFLIWIGRKQFCRRIKHYRRIHIIGRQICQNAVFKLIPSVHDSKSTIDLADRFNNFQCLQALWVIFLFNGNFIIW